MRAVAAQNKAYEKKCQLNSETRSTSVVMSVCTWALLEKSSSVESSPLASALLAPASPPTGVEALLGAFDALELEEATSFLMRVLANRVVFN